jgi:drug/metabolite transporter (DMT)-like permease
VLLALLGFFLFATSDAVVKVLTARYSVLQLIPVHVAFAALPLLVSTVRAGDLGVLRPRHPGLVALRGLPAGAGTAPNFYAFSTLPLADVYAIIFGVPLVVAVLAVPVLGERADARRWAAVLAGFAGVLVMVRPRGRRPLPRPPRRPGLGVRRRRRHPDPAPDRPRGAGRGAGASGGAGPLGRGPAGRRPPPGRAAGRPRPTWACSRCRAR